MTTPGQKKLALDLLSTREFENGLAKVIEERLILVTSDICETEHGAERKRGQRDTLRWFLRLKESLSADLQNLDVDTASSG